MALNKLDKTSREFSESTHQDEEEFMIILKDLIDKVNTGFDKTNEHINKVASMQTEINTEKNKDGITTAQANAIVENTAKTGISTAQANAITDNTAKTGITAQQATDITTNNAKVVMTTKQSQQLTLAVNNMIQLSSSIKNTTLDRLALTLIPGRTLGNYSLRLSIRINVSGDKTTTQYIDLPLTAGK